MKINNIQLSVDKRDSTVLLTADCTIRYFGSDKIYFKFDSKYKEYISVDASPFVAALLVPSMALGQDLIVKGGVSKKFYENLHKIMETMLSWNIGLKPISVFVDTITEDVFTPAYNASFFSGGVDSFYTYLKNKNSNDAKISHFILARGYDINLSDKNLWDMTCKTVQDVAEKEGVKVVKIESNIREHIEPIIAWDYTHGGCLAALGLSLRVGLKKVYVASSYTYDQLFPWGSHPDIDPYWSTETLSFVHDGADTSRVEKVKYIAGNSLVWKNLRVCYLNVKSMFNCGVCDKCVRTMIGLLIAGYLDKSETFPREVSTHLIDTLNIEGEHGSIFHRENLVELQRIGIRPDLQKSIEDALRRVNLSPKVSTVDILKKIRRFDYLYLRDFLYHFYKLKKLFGK